MSRHRAFYALLALGLVSSPAAAFCPSYTASSSSNSNNCGVEAAPGTNPSPTAWQDIFHLVAQGPSVWGAAGPAVGDIGQGCGKPEPSHNVAARFPCEILKAIAMQESGWRQFCAPDEPGDQVGKSSRTIIAFDCGYGIGQVTSGMHNGENPAFDRAQVAADPTYNLATGTQILAEKWKATNCVGDNQPTVVEDWYTAVWAYNGLAYSNNPNNPNHDPNRGVWDPNVGGSYTYQERVFGWVEHPPAADYWPSVALAYPDRKDVGTSGSPPNLPEPSCASPTDCGSTRSVHASACFGAGGAAGAGGSGNAGQMGVGGSTAGTGAAGTGTAGTGTAGTGTAGSGTAGKGTAGAGAAGKGAAGTGGKSGAGTSLGGTTAAAGAGATTGLGGGGKDAGAGGVGAKAATAGAGGGKGLAEAPAGAESTGCGCRTASAESGVGLWVGLALAGIAAHRRRVRRARAHRTFRSHATSSRGGTGTPRVVSLAVMTHRSLVSVLPLFALLLGGCQSSVSTAARAPSILPLRTLRLYETGVGYFERSGGVDPKEATSLPVPAGHLDDALKSLVILSADGKAKVHGLEFGSSMSKGMARALAGLPGAGDAPIAYRDLLVSLKGAHILVTTRDGMVSGRLAEVTDEPAEERLHPKKEGEAAKASDAEAPVEPPTHVLGLIVLTDAGEVRRFRATEVIAVKPTDPAFATRIGAALDALSTRSAQTTRPLRLLADTSGNVTFGYVAETPIWRTTYRLVLGADAKGARLQGWALLHNDTDEDWRAVRLELVNGRPDSFLFPLAAPRYARRSLLHPDEALSTVPQLLDMTPDGMWGDDGIALGDIGTIGHGSGTGSGQGFGSGHGRLSGIGSGGGGVGSSSLLSVGNLADLAQSTGVEAGALFTYTVGTPVSLGAHSSSLVPFLEQPLTTEMVTWVDGVGATPRSSVRFVNATGQTLPAGTIAFFGNGGFSGETTLDRLKPGERRFLSFGADLDVEVTEKKTKTRETPKRLTFDHDVLEEHFLRTSDLTWELENRSGAARAVYVVLHLDRNAKVEGPDELDFDTASNRPVAIFKVDPKKRASRVFTAIEGLSRRTSFSALSAERLTKLAAEAELPAPDRAIATEAAARQGELEAAHKEVEATRSEIGAIDKDLERLREHLRAMGGEKGAVGPQNPFVKRILEKEDALAVQRKKLDALEKDAKKRVEAVRTALAKLKV